MLEFIGSALLLIGAAFALIGSIGLVRLPDVFMRLHAPTKATTLGVGGVLVGSIVLLAGETGSLAIKELLITVFLFITAPVSAHLMARAAIRRGCESTCGLPEDPPGRASARAE